MSEDVPGEVLRFVTRALDDIYSRTDNIIKSMNELNKTLKSLKEGLDKNTKSMVEQIEKLGKQNKDLRVSMISKVSELENKAHSDLQLILSEVKNRNPKEMVETLDRLLKKTRSAAWLVQLTSLSRELTKVLESLA
ncbi:MAG: hypothetical protein ACFE7E_00385 [Candidatus Hodarchaeota archaeon]